MTISDLRIRSKLALVITLLFVPILLLAWLFVQQSFKDIDFSEKKAPASPICAAPRGPC